MQRIDSFFSSHEFRYLALFDYFSFFFYIFYIFLAYQSDQNCRIMIYSRFQVMVLAARINTV